MQTKQWSCGKFHIKEIKEKLKKKHCGEWTILLRVKQNKGPSSQGCGFSSFL